MHTARFVESYFNAWNHGDPKGVADHLTADGVYCDIPQQQQRTHDELITTLSDFFASHRLRYELIGDVLASRDTIAFQYRACRAGEVEVDKNPGAYTGAEFMTLHGDAAATITDYYDIPGMTKPAKLAPLSSSEVRQHKYAKSGLSDERMAEYKNRLESIMRSEQAFLLSDLTLPKLANAIGCSVNHLSQVINSGFGLSFFDYLNGYRISYARDLLATPGGKSAAILNIAFTVGFNSNSAFYAAFKKCVGQTPAQYRRNRAGRSH